MHGFWVVGDCEATDGNDGEFVWQIILSHPEARRADRTVATDNFPESDGQVEIGEGTYALATYELEVENVAEAVRDDVTVTFYMTEHDPGGADPTMDLRSGSSPIPFSPSRRRSTGRSSSDR